MRHKNYFNIRDAPKKRLKKKNMFIRVEVQKSIIFPISESPICKLYQVITTLSGVEVVTKGRQLAIACINEVFKREVRGII